VDYITLFYLVPTLPRPPSPRRRSTTLPLFELRVFLYSPSTRKKQDSRATSREFFSSIGLFSPDAPKRLRLQATLLGAMLPSGATKNEVALLKSLHPFFPPYKAFPFQRLTTLFLPGEFFPRPSFLFQFEGASLFPLHSFRRFSEAAPPTAFPPRAGCTPPLFRRGTFFTWFLDTTAATFSSSRLNPDGSHLFKIRAPQVFGSSRFSPGRPELLGLDPLMDKGGLSCD